MLSLASLLLMEVACFDEDPEEFSELSELSPSKVTIGAFPQGHWIQSISNLVSMTGADLTLGNVIVEENNITSFENPGTKQENT